MNVFSFCQTGMNIFFLYRAEDEMDAYFPLPIPILFLIWPLMIINVVASIALWSFIAAYTGGYVFVAILMVFITNWLSLTCFKEKRIQSQMIEQQSENPGLEFSSSNVETAMISTLLSCVVGRNNRGVFLSQAFSANLSKLFILCSIWYLHWNRPEGFNELNTQYLNTPFVSCVHLPNGTESYCQEILTNSTDPLLQNHCFYKNLESFLSNVGGLFDGFDLVFGFDTAQLQGVQKIR